MKKRDNEKIDQIEKALKIAYRNRDNIEVNAGWQTDVMRQIRNLHSSESKSTPFWALGRMACQLMPMTCLLISMVCVGLLATDFNPEYEIAALFINSPLEYDYFLSFNLM
jgi:hypothetical protein